MMFEARISFTRDGRKFEQAWLADKTSENQPFKVSVSDLGFVVQEKDERLGMDAVEHAAWFVADFLATCREPSAFVAINFVNSVAGRRAVIGQAVVCSSGVARMRGRYSTRS